MRAVWRGEWDWPGEQEEEVAGAGCSKDRHGEVRAHRMADLQWVRAEGGGGAGCKHRSRLGQEQEYVSS